VCFSTYKAQGFHTIPSLPHLLIALSSSIYKYHWTNCLVERYMNPTDSRSKLTLIFGIVAINIMVSANALDPSHVRSFASSRIEYKAIYRIPGDGAVILVGRNAKLGLHLTTSSARTI
jgi:hypothetical protein